MSIMKRFLFVSLSGFFRRTAIVAAFLVMSFLPIDLLAITYLRAGAPAGGDGASWETACAEFSDAIQKANAGDKTIYAAGGVYFVKEKTEFSGVSKIYGGFPGLSMDETLEQRDTEEHQTILTADVELDDYWVHVEPVLGEYKFSYTDLPGSPVIANGAFNPPPPYTGDYDAYVAKFNSTNKFDTTFQIGPGAETTLDGIWFIGFHYQGSWISIAKEAGSTSIHDCRFLGGNVGSTIFEQSNKARVTSCQFRYLKGGASGVSTRGGTLIEDCLFESLVREGSSTGAVLYFSHGKNTLVRRCVFVRSLNRSTHEGHESSLYYPPANIVSSYTGSGTFADCVISNCLSTSPFQYGSPLFGLKYGAVLHCAFLNNRYEVKPVEGRTYPMFATVRAAQDFYQAVKGCTFRGNVAAAPQVAATSGSYVLAIAGTGCDYSRYAFVNCTFDSNSVEHQVVEGVEPILSRALVSVALTSDVVPEIGVANCTFSGPSSEGVYDIVQYGPCHNLPTVVVNSLFMADGMDVANPFYVETPSQFRLVDSTVKNVVASDWAFDVSGLQYDEVPFLDEESASVSHVPVLVPAVRTPCIREASDVSTNFTSIGAVSAYRYCPYGEDQWLPLMPVLEKSVSAKGVIPIDDANGHPRAFGSFTRGAVQPLSDEAETGASLVLRRSPFDGGTLLGPSAQAVPKGVAPDPVTARPVKGNTFDGWYETNGILVTKSEELSLGPLNTDRLLIARFITPNISITFDLGEAGTFRENGRSSITIATHAKELFPAVPAYNPSPDWLIDGWSPEFPPFVPDKDAAYSASYVTAYTNIVYVVPPGEEPPGGDGSGASWKNATTNLNEACLEAGRYRGEVWMKEGRYPLSAPLVARSNVSIVGGFAGTESSASEADPVAHPVIITGDLSGDDCWAPNGVVPEAADRVSVWNGLCFADPNPGNSDLYWEAYDESGDDTWGFLNDQNGAFTNVSLVGVTLTGFGQSVIKIETTSSLALRDCRFLANGSAWFGENGESMISCKEASLEMERCELAGNYYPVAISTRSQNKPPSILRKCVFRDNISRVGTAGVRVDGYQGIVLDGCSFVRNCGASSRVYCTSAFFGFSRDSDIIVTNCLFQGNKAVNGCYGTVQRANYSPSMQITGCSFIGNLLSNPSVEMGSACIVRNGDSKAMVIRDSYFEGNRVETGKDTTDKLWSSVLTAKRSASNSYYGTIFLNCAMVGNSASNGASGPAIGTISTCYPVSFVNSLIDRSEFQGDAAEIVAPTGTVDTTFSVINTVMRNQAAGYKPFALLSPELGVSIASSAISGLDEEALPRGPEDYRYQVSSAPGLISPTKFGPDGRRSRGISASSPYARAGRPVWQDSTKKCYIYDTQANPDRPWRDVLDKTSCLKSVGGLTLEVPLIPDAFGAPRVAGKIAYGPLNAASSGTVLFLR